MANINLVNLNVTPIDKTANISNILIEQLSTLSKDVTTVNIIKIKFADGRASLVQATINSIRTILKDLNVHNCIFVPIAEGLIEDLTIDRIEVVHHESNN